MSTEKTSMPSLSADSGVEWVDGRNQKRKLTQQELMALSGGDREKLMSILARWKAIPHPRGRAGTLLIRNIYYILNRDKCRKWEMEHPERVREISDSWYDRNKLRHRESTYRNRKKNIVRVRELQRKRDNERRNLDPEYALRYTLKCRIRGVLREHGVKKSRRTEDLLGCSIAFAKHHIESLFATGMTWKNRRLWHVDHHVPLAAFVVMDLEEQLVAFNWKNLRPLWGPDNQKKKDTIPSPLPSWLPTHIAQRIQERTHAKTKATSLSTVD